MVLRDDAARNSQRCVSLYRTHRSRAAAAPCGVCLSSNSSSNYDNDETTGSGHDLAKRHPIEHAIDNTARWWQSPTLLAGGDEYVTITLDLKQVRGS